MPIFIVEGAGAAPNEAAARRIASYKPAAGAGKPVAGKPVAGAGGFAVFDAASEAAVREALGGSGAGAAVWAAVNLSPSAPAAGRELYVVDERFEPPIDLSKAAPENPELSPCLQRHDVNWVTSFIAADGTQCRCVYDATEAEAVRGAYRAARMPFVKVWRAQREA